MPLLPPLVKSNFPTMCEECRTMFDVVDGGICVKCGRILCFKDLFGSRLRRLMSGFGRPSVCGKCRRGETPVP